MAKIFKGDVNFGFVINQTGAQPLDSRSVVKSYAELLKYETFGDAIYNGMTVATTDEQKVYMLIDDTKATSADGWKEVGAGGAVAVDTYADAVVLATNDNIGQVIFVKTSDETYERAPYIVTGEGSLQKLAASNSDGTGLDADVAKLKETVGDANSGLVQAVGLKVNTSDFETYKGEVETALIGKVDNDALDTYKQEVAADLDEKVDDEEFATYQGQVSDLLAGKVDNDALNTYKQEVAADFDAKVDDSVFETYKEGIETYKGEVTEQLNLKATNADLQDLTSQVNTDIQNLANHLTEYSTTLEEVDGRIDSLETFVEGHINHGRIDESEIAELFTQHQE